MLRIPVLFLALLRAGPAETIEVGRILSPGPVTQGKPVTFDIPVKGDWSNPFDTEEIKVEAVVRMPDGTEATFPCYYYQPYGLVSRKTIDVRRSVDKVHFDLGDRGRRSASSLDFYLDDLVLSSRKMATETVLDAGEDERAWSVSGLEMNVSRKYRTEGEGSVKFSLQRSLGQRTRATLILPHQGADWSAYDFLEFDILVRSRKDETAVKVILDSTEQGQFSETFTSTAGSIIPGKWNHIRMGLPRPRLKSQWLPEGKATWRFRYCPRQAGLYSFHVYAESATEWAKSNPVSFRAGPGDGRGPIRISRGGTGYFEYTSGEPFFPIGLNICWADPLQYGVYLKNLAANGGNLVRLWMCPWNFPLEWKQAGRYDQEAAAKMDTVFALCERLGIKIMLCLDYHGAIKRAESWGKHPYAKRNHGPCRSPHDFFQNGFALRLYRNRLKYLIARYSSSPSLFAWELFNEVELTDATNSYKSDILKWHDLMANFIRLNDPYGRLVTTSVSKLADWQEYLWKLDGIEFLQTHGYPEQRFFSEETKRSISSLKGFGKPVFLGEFGLRQEPARNLDQAGIALHNAAWASVLQGAAGSAMPWWWDTYIHEFDLYYHLRGLSRFVRAVNFPTEDFRPIRHWTIDFPAGTPEKPGTLVIQPEGTSFERAPFNRPREFRIREDGTVLGSLPVAETLHGLGPHARLHNPQTFQVNFLRDGAFGFFVTSVTNWNSSALKISVDGRVALRERFPDRDPNRGEQHRYNGLYRIPVQKGRHSITVESDGRDWIKGGYVLENYITSGPHPMALYGMAGKTKALVWIRQRASVHYAKALGLELKPLEGARLTLTDLRPGQWKAIFMDTISGEELSHQVVGSNPVTFRLPPVLHDVAIRLERE